MMSTIDCVRVCPPAPLSEPQNTFDSSTNASLAAENSQRPLPSKQSQRKNISIDMNEELDDSDITVDIDFKVQRKRRRRKQVSGSSNDTVTSADKLVFAPTPRFTTIFATGWFWQALDWAK